MPCYRECILCDPADPLLFRCAACAALGCLVGLLMTGTTRGYLHPRFWGCCSSQAIVPWRTGFWCCREARSIVWPSPDIAKPVPSWFTCGLWKTRCGLMWSVATRLEGCRGKFFRGDGFLVSWTLSSPQKTCKPRDLLQLPVARAAEESSLQPQLGEGHLDFVVINLFTDTNFLHSVCK